MKAPRRFVYLAVVVALSVFLWVATTWRIPEPSHAIATANDHITHTVRAEAEAKMLAKKLDRSVAVAHAKTEVARKVAHGVRSAIPRIDSASHTELLSVVRTQDTVIAKQEDELRLHEAQHAVDSSVIVAADARADAEHAKVVVLETTVKPSRCGAKCGAALTVGAVVLTALLAGAVR